MIGEPPSLFGDQFHVSWPEAGLVGEETVGAAGTEVAIKLADAVPLVPTAFVADTAKVYFDPPVRFEQVMVVTFPEPEHAPLQA